MTPFLLVFGGAIITFALVTGLVGPGVVDGTWRVPAGVVGALGWIGLQGVMNGLRTRRALPRMRVLAEAVSKGLRRFDAMSLARAIERGGVVLAYFRSNDDLPSLRMSPLIAEVSAVLGKRATVGLVDLDETPEIADEHGVARLPTLILFAEGAERERFVGLVSPARLRRALELLL